MFAYYRHSLEIKDIIKLEKKMEKHRIDLQKKENTWVDKNP